MGTERVTVPFPCTGVLSPARDVFVTCSGMLGSTPPPPPHKLRVGSSVPWDFPMLMLTRGFRDEVVVVDLRVCYNRASLT